MPVPYRRQEPPAAPELIDQLEQRIGRALPAGYRAYLAGQDGGRLADNDHAAKTVLGVGEVPEWASMWDTLRTYEGRVPSWLLPVADDEYGNLFAVSLRPDDLGTVWFWDHEDEADEGEPPSEDNITIKAPDWQTFLDSLCPLGGPGVSP